MGKRPGEHDAVDAASRGAGNNIDVNAEIQAAPDGFQKVAIARRRTVLEIGSGDGLGGVLQRLGVKARLARLRGPDQV